MPPPVSMFMTSALCDGIRSGVSKRRGLPIAWALTPAGSGVAGSIGLKPALCLSRFAQAGWPQMVVSAALRKRSRSFSELRTW